MPPVVKKKGEALPPIKAVLDDLAARQRELDTLDTQLSGLIKRIEEALRKHVSIRLATDLGDPLPGEFSVLAFGKFDGKWQLAIEAGLYQDEDSGTVTPLLSAPRETRMRVFTNGHIEALVRGATVQLDRQLDERRKAIELGTALAQALDGVPF